MLYGVARVFTVEGVGTLAFQCFFQNPTFWFMAVVDGVPVSRVFHVVLDCIVLKENRIEFCLHE